MPAWQRVGAPAWAEFSRWADRGAAGLILYPLEGIGGAILGGYLARHLLHDTDGVGLIGATIGAVILLVLYHALARGRRRRSYF